MKASFYCTKRNLPANQEDAYRQMMSIAKPIPINSFVRGVNNNELRLASQLLGFGSRDSESPKTLAQAELEGVVRFMKSKIKGRNAYLLVLVGDEFDDSWFQLDDPLDYDLDTLVDIDYPERKDNSLSDFIDKDDDVKNVLIFIEEKKNTTD